MTLALAITFNAVLMLALLGALAFAMSHASRLKQHLSASVVPAIEPVAVSRPLLARRARSFNTALAAARP
jgi:hypothetical protein